jgi:VCBS repeat-containing protein
MNMTSKHFDARRSLRPFVILAALLSMGVARGQITVPAPGVYTNSSQSVTFNGTFTVAPGSMVVSRSIQFISPPGFVTLPNIVLGGSGSNRTVAVTRNSQTSGTVQVRLTSSTATNSFFVVFPPNEPPTVTPPGTVNMNEDTTASRNFTIGDTDTSPLSSLTVTASSSNTTLFPSGSITLSGTGATRTILLDPADNDHGSATITLSVSDQETTVTGTFTVNVAAVNDSPTLTGSVAVELPDTGPGLLMPSVVVGDVDHKPPGSPESITATVTLTSTLLGTLPGDSDTFVTTGTPAAVTTALQGLLFTPIANRDTPGTTGTLGYTIVLNDGTVSPSFSRSTNIRSVNNPPVVVGGLNPTTVAEGASVQPFFITSITEQDVNDTLFSVQVELVNGSQSGLGTFSPSPSLSNANLSNIQSFLQNLTYSSTAGTLTGASEAVPMRIRVTDGFSGTMAITNTLTIVAQQTAPTIFGVPVQTVNLTDAPTAYTPFPTVSANDVDAGGTQQISATITASNPALGTLSQSTFSLTSAASLTQALRAITYTPIPGVLPINTTGNVTLTIRVTDATGLFVQNSNLTLAIKAVNNAPQILGVPAPALQPLLLPPAAPIRPFGGLGLTNDDSNPVTFTITLDNAAKGTLANLGGFAQTVPGTYAMTGPLANILGALTNLHYVVSGAYLFPADDPGGTTFTLTARDFALQGSTKTLYVQVQDAPRNHLVTRTLNDGLPGSLTYVLANAGNNDVVTFALPVYPATIRLPGSNPSLITRNLTFKGPGANLLTLSGDGNGDLAPDRQLFRIAARVTFEGLTLSHGTAAYGGAVQVLGSGSLTLRDCAVVNSVATYYGGGIDVDGGQLALERCFIGDNRVSEEDGKGGGGVSLYSNKEMRFTNTTFARNVQPSENGDGGGALVVENLDPGTVMNTFLTHCTFAENEDASGRASAILSLVFGTRVRPQFCIFRDQSGRNLNVSNAGDIISLGGNISDDSTRTLLTQGGESEEVFLLDHVTDLTNTDAKLAPLVQIGNPTPYYPLLSGSPAIGLAPASTQSLDQRGVLRLAPAESGATEFNALQRLVINEIDFEDGTLDYVEIYARRDSAPIDLSIYSLYVDGVKVHEFSSSQIIGTNATFTAGSAANTLLNPGFGIVVAFTNNAINVTSDINPTPVVEASLRPAQNLPSRGIITLGLGGAQSPIAESTYLGVYQDPASASNLLLNIAGNSIALAPQFLGHALVPHAWIMPGPFDGIDPTRSLLTNTNSIGSDVTGTPFGLDNAQPFAQPDFANLSEDDTSILDVLDNDYDADGNDRLVIVDASTASAPGAGNTAVTLSQLGAVVSLSPTNTPLRGSQVFYDPTSTAFFQALPVNVEVIDTFYYEILDVGFGPVEGYPAGTGLSTEVLATNHRFNTGDSIAISGSSVSAYNGTHAITVIDENSFSIPVAYAGPAAANGHWQGTLPRSPTTRSEASVSIRVTGVNDIPVATPDLIAGVDEHDVARIMVRPEFAGSVLSFDTDPVPTPRMLPDEILSNDTDVDNGDTWETLRVVGVFGDVNPISHYSGTPGESPVIVHSPAHGLTSGTELLIANYGGHMSYNGSHVITVLDADSFSIPRFFVDNDPVRGVWVVLNDANRYQATTDVGAVVTLNLRADPREDHLIYDANPSAFLNGLAEGETFTNRFYYAVTDQQGGIGIGPVAIVVTGLNDTPVASPDPNDLGGLDPLVGGSNTLESVLDDGLTPMYVLPPDSGAPGQANLHALDPGGTIPGTIVLSNLWFTNEETPFEIDTLELLANDSDIDRLDVLSVVGVDAGSREGAALALAGGRISFDPTISSNLQALARGEYRIDTFSIQVSDSNTAGTVTSLVAVLVVGVNDTPIAKPDFIGLTEDEIFTFNPILHPTTNSVLHDMDIDINGTNPDDRLAMIAVSNLLTVGEALVNILPQSAAYDARVSEILNQLADWQTYTDTFAYTITDNSYLFANDDEFHVPLNSAARVLDVLANDRDLTPVAGDLVIVGVGPTFFGGNVSIAPGGTHLLYTSPADAVGDDYFQYTVEGEQGDRRSARVHVRSVVPRLNGILNASDDEYTVAFGETVTLNVLANDNMLPDGAGPLVLSPTVLSSTIPGQPVFSGNAFVYTATNGLANLAFTYQISAGGDAVASADVVVRIVDRRDTLLVRDDSYSVQAGSIGNELDILANDALINAPTDGLRVQAILDPAVLGTLATNATATGLVYTPNPGVIGTERIRYRATDRVGGTGTGLVEIVVGRIDVASDFFTVAASPAAVAVNLNVLANDRVLPFPAGALTLVSVSPAGPVAIGELVVNGLGTQLQFTPNGTVGQLDFDYVVRDASTPPRTATGRVSIATVPAGIYANVDRHIVRGGSAGNVLDVLANDITYPNANKTYSILSIGAGPNAPNAGGSVSIVDNKLSYTPAPGFFGEETFSYLMSDSTATDSAVVTVVVRRGDLVANDDHYTVFHEIVAGGGTAQAFTLPVILNDRIQPAQDQVMQIVGLGVGANAPDQGGSVSIAPDGLSLVYRPVTVPSPSYTERFTYEISDGTERRSSAVVEVRVNQRAGDLEVITQDDAYTVARNSLNNMLPVLANDGVLPASATGWTIKTVSATARGGGVGIEGNNLRYTPPTGFVGADEFTYTVSDGLGGTGGATVRVRVGNLPVAPDRFAALAGSTNNEFDVLANDLFLPSYAGEYVLDNAFGATQGGSLALSAGNTVFYTPDAGYAGAYPYSEGFAYRIVDDAGGYVTGRVEVLVYDPATALSTTNVTVLVQGMNDQPEIHNTPTAPRITDKETAFPFLGVTFVEFDEQLQEVIDILVTMPNPAQGAITTLAGFTDLGGGQYELTNVTAAVGTSLIRQLVYTPVENRITVPTTEAAYFHITITDNKSPPVTDTNSVVHVTAVNDAPLIAGTVEGQEFFYLLPITPFTTVLVTEVDDLTLQPLDVTVTILQPDQGLLANLGPFAQITNGVYQALNLTAAQATSALRDLEFLSGTNVVAVGGSLETRFRISVDDGFAPPVQDQVTSVVARNAAVAAVHPANVNLQGSYGLEVDAIDEYAIVGAPNTTTNGVNSGSAFIYQREAGSTNTWTQWRHLQPASVNANDRFGRSVAITEQSAAVGAIQGESGSVETGAAFVFDRNLGGADNWGERTRIVPAGLTTAMRFGFSVALHGDFLAVGAPDARFNPTDPVSGAVFVYERNAGGPNNWGEVYRYAPTAAAATTSTFGWSVSLAENRLVVGAPLYNTDADATREGAVFVFNRDPGTGTWSMDQMISSTENNVSLEFGWDVSVDAEMLAVGAPAMTAGATPGAGRVFLYAPSGPAQFADAGQLDRRSDNERRFGHSLSVKTDSLFVGAPHNIGAQNIGAAYVYSRDVVTPSTWNMVSKLNRPTGSVAGLYGTSVAFKRGTAIVGAPADLSLINNRGYAYLYRFGYNRAPIVVATIPDVHMVLGESLALPVPANTFLDPDDDDTLVIAASFPDGANGLALAAGQIAGTPLAIGSYRVQLTATDLAGLSTSLVVRVHVSNSASPARPIWDSAKFPGSFPNPALAATVWGGGANPDGDAADNDQEYAFGGDPNVADSVAIELEPDGLGNLLVRYNRRTNDPGLSYALESNDNITGWTNRDDRILSETSSVIDAEFERVTLKVRLIVGEPVLNYRIFVTF